MIFELRSSLLIVKLFIGLSVYTAIQGIIDATNDQLKEIEKDCAENNEVSWIYMCE